MYLDQPQEKKFYVDSANIMYHNIEQLNHAMEH